MSNMIVRVDYVDPSGFPILVTMPDRSDAKKTIRSSIRTFLAHPGYTDEDLCRLVKESWKEISDVQVIESSESRLHVRARLAYEVTLGELATVGVIPKTYSQKLERTLGPDWTELTPSTLKQLEARLLARRNGKVSTELVKQ